MLWVPALVCLIALCVHGVHIPLDLFPRFQLEDGVNVIGGRPIAIQEAPHQVSLQIMNNLLCSGSIISDRHVLSAAHCTLFGTSGVSIGFSSVALSTANIVEAIKFIKHPKFHWKTIDFDVSVLTAAKPFDFNNVTRPIALVDIGEEPSEGDKVTVFGWGSTGDGRHSETLMAVDVNIFSREKCIQDFKLVREVTVRMICAGVATGGKDACHGDSGGALIIPEPEKQIGIVSWGKGCAKPEYPGVYTNIAHKDVHDFITEQTAE